MNSYYAVLAFCLVAAVSATLPEKCNKCSITDKDPTSMPDCGTDMETCSSDGDEWCMR